MNDNNTPEKFKISKATKQTSLQILAGCIILFSIMLAIFFVFGKLDTSVLLGGLVSTALASLNFFVMCLSKEKELRMEPNKAKTFSIFSYNSRMFIVLISVLLCYALLKFNLISLLAPLLFPRITILFLTLSVYKKGGKN